MMGNTESRGTIDAAQVLRALQSDNCKPSGGQYEIPVSFRKNGRTIGRRDYATHWIHWYPAKMFQRIPSAFLDNVAIGHASHILDPFCGSGTVLLEANLRGHSAIGIDVNPFAQLISRVKVTPLPPNELTPYLHHIIPRAKRSRSQPQKHSLLDSWIHPIARPALHNLSIAISDIPDEDIKAFFLITLTSIVRCLSLADPAIPPLVRLRQDRAHLAGKRYRKALDRSRSMSPALVYKAFADAAIRNIRRMSELYDVQSALGSTQFTSNGSHAASTGLKSNSIDAIITSPPYCGSQKYVRSMKLEMTLMGCLQPELQHIDRHTLGTEAVSTRARPLDKLLTDDQSVDRIITEVHRRNPVRALIASDYSRYLTSFANECARLLRPGGHLLVTFGRSTVAGIPFPADRIFSHAAKAADLRYIATLVDRIPSRGLLTQRHRTAGRIDFEYIVWLRQPDVATRCPEH